MSRPHLTCGSLLSTQGGVTSIEFSVTLPLLIVLLGIIIDGGLLFFASYMLDDAARMGARHAAVELDFDSGKYADLNTFVRSRIPNIELFDNLSVTIEGPSDMSNDGVEQTMIRVSITGTYQFHFLRLIGYSSIPLRQSAVMRYEWQALG